MSEIRLVERDEKIIKELDRWRVVQGKHIKHLRGLADWSSWNRGLRRIATMSQIPLVNRLQTKKKYDWFCPKAKLVIFFCVCV